MDKESQYPGIYMKNHSLTKDSLLTLPVKLVLELADFHNHDESASVSSAHQDVLFYKLMTAETNFLREVHKYYSIDVFQGLQFRFAASIQEGF